MRALARSSLRTVRRMLGGALRSGGYAARISRERAYYAGREHVHDLPPIFHYWSNRYLRPKLEKFGFAHPDAFFAVHVARALRAREGGEGRIASIGAGNCDSEVRLAKALVGEGCRNFTIECIDINAQMLARGRRQAEEDGVAPLLRFTEMDFNRWTPSGRYDAVVANQSLHHVLALEHLFDAIRDALAPSGLFVTSDMIGRNGHQRWPEARAIVDEFWAELPPAYRVNLQLGRTEERFLDWDCSADGFEGIRAQEVLPLLIERFDFALFIAFGNVVDPFIDRSFGHHFDPAIAWDRDFIDRVHARDEREIEAGRITPTHMMAVLCTGRSAERRMLGGLTPARCVRKA
jgi:SAM-dependent methyltransferase